MILSPEIKIWIQEIIYSRSYLTLIFEYKTADLIIKFEV